MFSFIRKLVPSSSFATGRPTAPAYNPDVLVQPRVRPADPTLSRPSQAPFVCYSPNCEAAFCPTHNSDYPHPAAAMNHENGTDTGHGHHHQGPFKASASLGAFAARPAVPQFRCYAMICMAENCPQHGQGLTESQTTLALPDSVSFSFTDSDVPQVVVCPPSPGFTALITAPVQSFEPALLAPIKPRKLTKRGRSKSKADKQEDKENKQKSQLNTAISFRKRRGGIFLVAQAGEIVYNETE